MSRVVVVVPIKDGAQAEVRALLAHGPPFELIATELERHEVYVTDREVVFVLESAGPSPALNPAEDPSRWKVAAAWDKLVAGRPRTAETAYAWARPDESDAVSFEPTPGPGDSEGGDIFAPAGEPPAESPSR